MKIKNFLTTFFLFLYLIKYYWKDRLNEENILEPDININIGTKYISMLIQKYGNINLALAAYNAGSGNVDGWIEKGTLKSDGSDIENVPFTETNNYVRKILRDYEIYKQIYEEK